MQEKRVLFRVVNLIILTGLCPCLTHKPSFTRTSSEAKAMINLQWGHTRRLDGTPKRMRETRGDLSTTESMARWYRPPMAIRDCPCPDFRAPGNEDACIGTNSPHTA